jgi:hypothetical protein
MYSLL